MKIIKVKCLNGFKIYKRNIFYAEAVEGKEYTAILCEDSGEYDTLKIGEDFELVS